MSDCKIVKAEAECATQNQIYNIHLDTVEGGSVMSHSDIALNTRNGNGAAKTVLLTIFCCGKQKAHLECLPQAVNLWTAHSTQTVSTQLS